MKEVNLQEYLNKYFPIVRASMLSIEDKFLNHEPRNSTQRMLKRELIYAIKSGLYDFRAQRIDPSIDESGKIIYEENSLPCVGKTPKQWKILAEEFLPEKESRLGTTKERIAFLGTLIKYLVEERGYEVRVAWREVCDLSKYLGHYWDSPNPKHKFELTGSRPVGEWYDLGNTKKITINDDERGGFSEFGGYYGISGYLYPLAEIIKVYYPSSPCKYSTGWVVTKV